MLLTVLQAELQSFLKSHLAEEAGTHLTDGATIVIHVDGAEEFSYVRKKGENTLSLGNTSKADLRFWVPLLTMRYLLNLAAKPEVGMGAMGVAILERLFHGEDSRIRFRVETGFIGLWSKGYFSVLKAGGPEVASYLTKRGFGSLGRLKDVLRKIGT